MKAAAFTELDGLGYVYLNHARCPRCGDDTILFRTPKAKRMHFSMLPTGKYVAHIVVCRVAKAVREERRPANRIPTRKHCFRRRGAWEFLSARRDDGTSITKMPLASVTASGLEIVAPRK
jgi:ribosomal protein S27AE